jgi:SM-20-related protein
MNLLFDSIATGLAEQDFAITDQFLSQPEVEAIVALPEFQADRTSFKKAGISKQVQVKEEIRGDYIQWLDKATAPGAVTVYLKRLDDLIRYLNRNLFLSLKDVEAHFTVYPPGTFYKRHLDQFKQDDHRKLSVICYLNNDWKPEHGGELRLYLPGRTRDVLPEAGRLVCFRSDRIEHEVLPATRERLSITGWMLDKEKFLV